MNSNRKTSIYNKKSIPPSKEWSNLKGLKRNRLILERKKRDLTQGQLAELIGVPTSTISHLENGRIKPNLDVALALQELFQLSFEILFPDL
ncbi:hypothetical protein C0971_15880 [Bacillus methanolicus]|uniref:helix-turn-helix transcriptional regulator n=1 Tax=Bacillus methanolicus TaxID=1471 RepID=UPI00200CF183|nr:helix-turn-helix transcriptional regulator [Bacillus methanolicus]UQD53333.1 hypothetical protein C0971_15880 [Bacillus methanolicus]